MNVLMFLVGLALVYGAGVAPGWTLARRSTRYMLGGNRRRKQVDIKAGEGAAP
jgi:hypothetical protein